MTTTTTPAPDWTRWLTDPLALSQAATEYARDSWQRSVLYADVRRRRGNQYRAHLREKTPNVLDFPADLILDGRELPQPVNYGLVRIRQPEGISADPGKRPFMVVDPRAGHGPGIGGFKPDSEIGAALHAGHPCYFVGFLPDPVPGQILDHVLRAQAAFVRKVAELHPDAIGKPVVIGNCQAGWQVMMSAAIDPELFGPIILAGAPMSYWAGRNPMRYSGGLLGGSWATAFTSDIGAGRFDGAWLVQNFENLDPANTLWTKQYNVYRHVDTEGPRYLGFERYWGGHVFLNGGEMQYIVDNLFIGNRLATAELRTADGARIDLRNIRSPVIVFCSHGDNITPPPQALGWITDLYRDDAEVAAYDQTIVFATHASIGHLGIFVSGSVGRKEHREFAANIDIIDLLPAGIYRAVVDDAPEAKDSTPDDPAYLMTIRRSGVDEVRAIVQPDPAAERRFAAAAQVSRINLAWYRNTVQPWVRAFATPLSARWLQALHPLRTGYEFWSDQHPLAAVTASLAAQVAEARQPAAEDNPFLQMQDAMSRATVQLLDRYRDQRDALCGLLFDTIYGAPAVQALAGIDARGEVRPHPGNSPQHRSELAAVQARMDEEVHQGGLPEAFARSLNFVFGARGEADGRHFRRMWELLRPHLAPDRTGPVPVSRLDAFRTLVRHQALLAQHDSEGVLAAIPALLRDVPADVLHRVANAIAEMAEQGGTLSAEEAERLRRVRGWFEGAEIASQSAPQKPAGRATARKAAKRS